MFAPLQNDSFLRACLRQPTDHTPVWLFFFEKNRPATFKYPLYSLMGDWVMYADIWRGRIKL